MTLFSLVNSSSDQNFNLGGDTPGNLYFYSVLYLYFIFIFFLLLVYFEYVARLEDCAFTGQELLALLAFNTFLVMASLLVSCITAFRGKRLQNKSAKYNVRIDPQETVPQVYFLSKNLDCVNKGFLILVFF